VPWLVFLSAEGEFYTGYYRKPDRLWEKQQAFWAQLSQERIRDTFTTPDELAGEVATAVGNWAQDHAPNAAGSVQGMKAKLRGAKAIAQGNGAAGRGGVAIVDDVHGEVVVGGVRREDSAARELHTAYLSRVLECCGYVSLAGIDPLAADQREADTRLIPITNRFYFFSADKIQGCSMLSRRGRRA
jgi:hypothetical protein